ncbi:flavin-containing monooxygenase [Sphingomonas jatrophae]|uniref:4-hydroxyacetophenone monooxygenase n=1 Tax=Sphingomonas jatrophae TaxID=1166337 RepID=A0A1I6KG57_9SPHN|nr:NAD(P)/FAD-dependent oxidoreductase [Sphingomonas jatrophae]SFR90231.1 4-hydroxyacetophenone monooxygenase [Sphingomonas jatrophae]
MATMRCNKEARGGMEAMTIEAGVEPAFIRRAMELADLNAVRLALYQHTRDPEIAALPPAARLDEAQRALLIDRAAAWLERHASTEQVAEPAEDDLRALMTLATGKEMSDMEFAARRDLPGFRRFPFAVDWQGEKPPVPEGFRIAIIGSGFSGIAAGVQCEILGLPYTVIERQPEVGGTWTINRYPDVRVDTPSVTYEFSFEKGYRWKEHFGRGEEVRNYLAHVSRKYGVHDNTLFSHDLQSATFDEARNLWVLEMATPDGPKMLEANIVITASGVFANAREPAFEGVETFRGRIVHPSKWPADLDLAGKRVAVIGNGSTGVQILGALAREAAHVSVFQRTPQWISPREKYGAPVEPELAWLIENFPAYQNWWRYMATAALFDIHDLQVPDPEWQAKGGHVNQANDALRDMLTGYIHKETGGRQDLIDKLVPDYAPFSRRPVVDNGWYRALTRDNVELVTDKIVRVTETGVVTEDGTEREIDVIVAAIGFDVVKYLAPARYTGAGGRDLHATWDEGDGPRAYLGEMVPGFPNMFMIYGPNSQPLSGGTGLPAWYMVWASYAAQAVMRMLEEGKSRIEVKQDAFERYNRALDQQAANLLQLTREGGVDKNYYVNAAHGRLQVNAPWLSPDFHRMCTVVEWDDLSLS